MTTVTSKSSKDRRTFHCIKPRYSPGVATTVDYEFAKMFSIQERNMYRKVLRGEFGEIERQRAERLGLQGIAETKIKHEDKKGRTTWSTIDLITNKEIEQSTEGPIIHEFRPIYVIAIEIMNDWDKPDYASEKLIKLMRQMNFITDSIDDISAPEVITKFLTLSNEWTNGITARPIKKELKNILCHQISKIEDDNVRALVKVICKRFE